MDEADEMLSMGFKDDLDFMCATLIQLVDIISYSQLFPGGLPVPDSSTSVVASNCKDALKNIKDNPDIKNIPIIIFSAYPNMKEMIFGYKLQI